MSDRIGVGVIGCGLIGERRAAVAAAHEATRIVAAADPVESRAEAVAARFGGDAHEDWRAVVDDPRTDIIVVATPNAYLAEIGVSALEHGAAVLLEKPMGRNREESERLASAARVSDGVLKVGFNHRYHPGLREAHDCVARGEIGRIVNIRARYGHGARPGYENEWRCDPEIAGGGHLTDQGVHVTDLVHWFLGLPARAVSFVQTAVWPIGPLEDNGHGLFRYDDGAVAQLHVSMTQWKNLFSFEVHGSRGAVSVEGLGGSYGPERLVRVQRRPEGGAPRMEERVFSEPDGSWAREWDDFVSTVRGDGPCYGGVEDGLAAMRMLDALYRSAAAGEIVEV